MADHQIPFKAPMVRAILREIEKPGSGKTQTRRILKPQPLPDDFVHLNGGRWEWRNGTRGGPLKVRYAPSDRLWVREAWRAWSQYDDTAPRNIPPCVDIQYAADAPISPWASRGRPSMFMPRWASRLTLYVTDVRVERLQSISEADAVAEGIHRIECVPSGRSEFQIYDPSTNGRTTSSPVKSYRSLWEIINGPGAWEANPWVVAYSFLPRLGNIDTLPATLQEAA